MKVILLHYRYLPSAAGVELMMGEQVRQLRAAGHEVTILTGAGKAQKWGERVVRVPDLAASCPDPENENFFRIAANLERTLRPWCEEADRVIIHNMLTMPFHLAATIVLRRLADQLPPGRFLHWLHDLAVVNPDYQLPRDESNALKWPWSLLGEAHEQIPTVAISPWRAEQFQELTGQPVIATLPNAIDPLALLPLTPNVRKLTQAEGLLDPGLLLFQPARLVARKRVETGLRVVAALRERGGWGGRPVRLMVTAAPDLHRADAKLYHDELLALRQELELEKEVLFLHEHFPVAHADLIALYSLADVLWFPSQQEGFGLPIVEGALHRLPVFCADLPPMNRFRLPGVGHFDPEGTPAAIAESLLAFLEEHTAFLEARKGAVGRFSSEHLAPQFLSMVADPSTFTANHTP